MRHLTPAAVFLFAYVATFAVVMWLHATFGLLLEDAVFGVWPFLGFAITTYAVPALAASFAVSMTGMRTRSRVALGGVYLAAIVAFFEVVQHIDTIVPFFLRDLLGAFGYIFFAAATAVLCLAFVALGQRASRLRDGSPANSAVAADFGPPRRLE